MSKIVKRAIVSVVIGIVVYFFGRLVVGMVSYDAYLEAIFYLSGVIAASCYWIGSANNNKSE